MNKLLLKFLRKFFFILRAAADGWRVIYRGGNVFDFYNQVTIEQSPEQFVDRYYPDII
jgi:hypothetical protein